MVQDVRSSAVGNAATFDLLSEAGVLAVLQAIRQSSLPSAQKSELRDLVFLYRNSGGGDPALRSQLENELKAVSLTVVPPVTNNQPAASAPAPVPVSRSGFSGGRPAPVFHKPTTVSMPTPAPVVATAVVVPPALDIKEAPVAQKEPTIPVVVPKIVLPQLPKLEDEVKVEEATVEPTKIPVNVAVNQTAVIKDDSPLIPSVATTPTAVPAKPTPSAPINDTEDLEAARKRIATIKQDINAKVGNAVNLLDRDNNIGREYMSALLEAMKAANNGVDLSTNMRRLEAAYKAVIDLVSENKPVSAAPATETEVVITPKMPMAPVSPVVTEQIIKPQNIEETRSWDLPAAAPEVSGTQVMPVTPVAAVAPVVSAAPVSNVAASPIPVRPAGVPLTPVATPASSLPVAPVAAAAPLKTPQDLPTAADMKARAGITDPLHSPEVDAGLDQLLSEWSLFRKSGIFGTGPHGRQHPLFIKMAPLSLSIILSGRFEGSTQEIRQSVTDYMNGWRYEQGVVYESDEQFEHYLRRVIRHIIDLQTSKRK